MKQCPLCKRYFDAENDFCLEDGTPLVAQSGANPFGGHSSAGDIPTEVITSVATPPQADLPTQAYQTPYAHQQAPPAQTKGPSGNILYLVIGVLATALVALTAYMLFLRETPKDREQPSANTSAQSTPSASPTSQSTPAATPASNTAAAAPTPAPASAPPSVAGSWSGDISYPSGTAFSASVQLSDTGANGVKGQITWTILRSSNPEKRDKAGLSATEYVEGSFDASGKVLSLRGVSKSDPSNIIILDRYRLNISPDSRSFTGVSTGGKTPGRVVLRRN